MRYKYYVAWIDYKNRLHFVTDINTDNKSWHSRKGEKAMAFSKTYADELMFGMVANGCPAVVVTAPDFVEYTEVGCAG